MVDVCGAERSRMRGIDFWDSALLTFVLIHSRSHDFCSKHLLLVQDSSRGKGHHSTHRNQGTSGRLAFRRGKALMLLYFINSDLI